MHALSAFEIVIHWCIHFIYGRSVSSCPSFQELEGSLLQFCFPELFVVSLSHNVTSLQRSLKIMRSETRSKYIPVYDPHFETLTHRASERRFITTCNYRNVCSSWRITALFLEYKLPCLWHVLINQ